METAPHDVQAVASDSQVLQLNPAPSFEDVYREHFGFVWATLLRLGVPRPGVEDAVQDVFVVVHRRLSDFEGRGAGLRSWLFTIVRRIAYRHRRGAQRADRKRRALAQVQPRPVALDEALDQRTAAALMMEALDELDHDKRVAIDLHVFEGLSGPKIAELLEINVDTAYSRIKAARRRLQRSLEARGLHGDPSPLVEAARRQTRPPRGAKRKVAAALGLRWAPAAPAAAATTAGASGGSGLKAVVLAVVLGGVGAAAVVGTNSEPPARAGRSASARSPQPEPTPVVAAPTRGTDVVSAEPAATPVPPPSPTNETTSPTRIRSASRRSRAAAAEAPPSPSPSPDAQLAAEVELLTQAKRALDGDPARALQLLDAHATRFGRGQLATERAGYRAIALCAMKRWAQGRGEARLFLADHPRSSLARRVQSACEISSDPP